MKHFVSLDRRQIPKSWHLQCKQYRRKTSTYSLINMCLLAYDTAVCLQDISCPKI